MRQLVLDRLLSGSIDLLFPRRPGLLASCNSASAGYLFQQDKFYDVSYDTGDKSVQCGRKVDAFQGTGCPTWIATKVNECCD